MYGKKSGGFTSELFYLYEKKTCQLQRSLGIAELDLVRECFVRAGVEFSRGRWFAESFFNREGRRIDLGEGAGNGAGASGSDE